MKTKECSTQEIHFMPSNVGLRPSALSLAVVSALACGTAAQHAWAAPSTNCPAASGGVITVSSAVAATDQDACSLSAAQSAVVQGSGSITMAAVGAEDFAGIVVPEGVTATRVTNGGAISVSGSNRLHGIRVEGTLTNGIANTGSIYGGGTPFDSQGIRIVEVLQGGLSNSGTISGSADGIRVGGVSRPIIGVALATLSGSLTNAATGLISGPTGIIVGTFAAVDAIVNEGSIKAIGTDAGRGRGLFLQGGSIGSVENRAGGVIGGDSPRQFSGVLVDYGTITTMSNAAGASIVGGGTASGLVGIGASEYGAITSLVNAGMVEGPSAGMSFARIDSLTNTGTIRATTAVGHGMVIDGGEGGPAQSVISNSGTIAGGASGVGILISSYCLVDDYCTEGGLVGSISNSGTISGGGAAIRASAKSPVLSGITNTGTLQGAVELDRSTLNLDGPAGRITGSVTGTTGSHVFVNGTFTSENTFNVGHFEIASTGVFKMKHAVTVVTNTTFVNAGVLEVAATDTASITGPYSQSASGTYRIGANSTSAFGKTVVVGSAAFPADANINVVVSNCGAFSPGNVLPAVFSATSMTTTTFAVTDNCPAFNFVASRNGNAIDLSIVAAAPPPEPQPIPTLGAWALMLLSLLMASLGLRRLAPGSGKAN